MWIHLSALTEIVIHIDHCDDEEIPSLQDRQDHARNLQVIRFVRVAPTMPGDVDPVSAKCIVTTVEALRCASEGPLSALKVVLHGFVSLTPEVLHPLPNVVLEDPWKEPEEECWVAWLAEDADEV